MHPVLSTIRTSGVLMCFAVLGYGTYRYGIQFGHLDPFEKYRGFDKIDMQAGIQLDKVDLKAYRFGKLVANANVASVTVTQDRNQLELTDISNGVYRGDSPIKFSSNRGSYNLAAQDLELRGGAHISGKDYDLHTDLANVNRADDQLNVPSPISGTLMGGTVSAASFTYFAKTGNLDTRLIHWHGKPPVAPDLPDQDESVVRAWDIESDHAFHDKANPSVYTYTTCKATDGEVLIYAPKAEWDRKTDILTASGRITYFSGKADMIADKVVVYKKEKRAYFTGNVIMLVKPKKDQDKPPTKEEIPEIKKESFSETLELPKEDTVLSAEDKKKAEELRKGSNLRDYPLHLQAQEINYWYGKGNRHANFNGDPVAKQDFPSGQWRMGWSNTGTYDGEKEILHLTSKDGKRDVRYKNSMGDLALAKTAEFSTTEAQSEDDNDLQLWDVTGIYKDTSGEDDRGKKGGSTSAPGAPPGTTPPGTTPPDHHGSGVS